MLQIFYIFYFIHKVDVFNGFRLPNHGSQNLIRVQIINI